MKVLFLDIDGVLNRVGTKERFKGFRGLDKQLVDRFLLWKTFFQPDLKIVLSSTWRTDIEFKQHVMERIPIYDVTPNKGNKSIEILEWLSNQKEPIEKWAVLDDCVILGLGGKLVQTSELHGVRDRNLEKINLLLT